MHPLIAHGITNKWWQNGRARWEIGNLLSILNSKVFNVGTIFKVVYFFKILENRIR